MKHAFQGSQREISYVRLRAIKFTCLYQPFKQYKENYGICTTERKAAYVFAPV
jgi:hypothetical protein